TLRHYRVTDAPSFRLIVNTVLHLTAGTTPAPKRDLAGTGDAEAPVGAVRSLVQQLRGRLAPMPIDGASPAEDAPFRWLVDDVAQRLDAAEAALRRAIEVRCGRRYSSRSKILEHLCRGAAARAGEELPFAQQLMEAELAAGWIACWSRIGEFDAVL